MAGVGGSGGRKWRQLYLNNNKKKHRIPLEARGLKEMITSNFDPWLGPELEGKMIAIRQILGHMWFLNIDCIPENSIISIYM